MQNDQAHAVQYMLMDALDNGVIHFVMGNVAPPDQNIGVVQNFLGQAVLRHIQGGGFYIKTGFGQKIGDAAMDALRVDFRDIGVFDFMDIFVPYGYAGCHNTAPSF